MQDVLNGRKNIEFHRHWIDLSLRSSVVPGNPDLLFLNQLKEGRRYARLATQKPLQPPNTVRAPIGSSSSDQSRLLTACSLAGTITVVINENNLIFFK